MAGTHTTSRPTGLEDTTTGESGSKVGEIATRGKEAVKEHGSELQKTAKSKVTQKADDGKTKAVDKARSVEDDLRDLVSSVREKQPQVADAFESVLDRAGSVVDYVDSTPVDQMTADLQRQVRTRPWLAVAGMFGAGFLLARAMKPVDGVIDSVRGGNTTTPQIPQRTGGTVSGQMPPTGTPVRY